MMLSRLARLGPELLTAGRSLAPGAALIRWESTQPAGSPPAEAAAAAPHGTPPPVGPDPAGPSPRAGATAGAETEPLYTFSSTERAFLKLLSLQLTPLSRSKYKAELEGDKLPQLLTATEAAFRELFFRHAPALPKPTQDSKHLHMMLLALAAYRTVGASELGPELARALVHINLGGKGMPVLASILRMRLGMQSFFLATPPLDMAADVTRLMCKDLEDSQLVSAQASRTEDSVQLHVSRCVPYEILKEEGAEELLPEFCCNQNYPYLELFRKHYKLDVECTSWRGTGDGECLLRASKPVIADPPATS